MENKECVTYHVYFWDGVDACYVDAHSYDDRRTWGDRGETAVMWRKMQRNADQLAFASSPSKGEWSHFSYWCRALIHFIHPITIFPIYLRTIARISSAPPEQKDCVSSAVWLRVPGHQRFSNKSAVELWSAPLCIPAKMTSSRPLLCLFLPRRAPFCS